MFGVRRFVFPVRPRSPQLSSSVRKMTMFGFAGSAAGAP